MLTQIEMQYMEAVKKIARVMSEPKQIDWEQRRYEIAKDVLGALFLDPKMDGYSGPEIAEIAVAQADNLIAALRKPKCQ